MSSSPATLSSGLNHHASYYTTLISSTTKSVVEQNSSEFLPVKIYGKEGSYGLKEFYMVSEDNPLKDTYRILGDMHLTWMRKLPGFPNDCIACENTLLPSPTDLWKGKLPLSYICIDRLLNYSKYLAPNSVEKKVCHLGIGRIFLQMAIEYSFYKGCEGRIKVQAAWNSHGFYYTMGLRSENQETNHAIEQELVIAKQEHRTSNTEKLDAVVMYLSAEKAQKLWKEKIEKNPLWPKDLEF